MYKVKIEMSRFIFLKYEIYIPLSGLQCEAPWYSDKVFHNVLNTGVIQNLSNGCPPVRFFCNVPAAVFGTLNNFF